MYAIIEVGAKQFMVEKGDVIDVEKQSVPEGKGLRLDKVLLISEGENLKVGQPYVPGASVSALVLKQTKGEKVVSFKYRRRKSSHWKKGHRQQLTRIKVEDILAG